MGLSVLKGGGDAGAVTADEAGAQAAATHAEYQVGVVSVDHVNGQALVSVQGRFDLKPTVFPIPFMLLDVITVQRLGYHLQRAGVINVSPIVGG